MLDHGLPLYFFGWGDWLMALLSFMTGVIATVLFLKWKKNPVPNEDRDNSMLILKNRYAQGEISKEDFEKMKGVLSS